LIFTWKKIYCSRQNICSKVT